MKLCDKEIKALMLNLLVFFTLLAFTLYIQSNDNTIFFIILVFIILYMIVKLFIVLKKYLDCSRL